MGQWQSQQVCTTPACIHAASHVLRNMTPNWAQMDPCTDFDKMVCYGAFEHNGDNSGTLTEVRKRTDRILRTIFESANSVEATGFKSTLLTARSNTEEDNFDMLRTAYQACMDTDAIALAGLKPLEDLIVTVNKTWAVSPTDLKTKVGKADFDGLHKTTLFLEQLDIPIFHGFCSEDGNPVMPDPLNSHVNRICWASPKMFLQLNLTAYLDPAALGRYSTVLGNIFHITYPRLDNKTTADLAKAVVALEADIVKAALTYKASLGPAGLDLYSTVKNVSVAAIAQAAPLFRFDKLLAGLTPAGKTPPVIFLDSPEFWPQYASIVANHSRAAVQGFMVWKTINAVAPHLGDPELTQALGIAPLIERWETCVAAADQTLRHIKDHYFISATYPELTMQAADKMTTNIRAQFKKRLGELDWMSPESKQRAMKKADNIVQNIGHPKSNPDVRSASSVAAYYTGLNLTATSHFTNALSALRFHTTKKYAEITHPPNRNAMANAADVNAYYNPMLNSISIPAGISQLPIFHYHLPDYALYGGLGSVIGHEITHGFDSTGRLWDEDAQRGAAGASWWDNSTVAAFQARAQCFVEQYSSFEVALPDGQKAKVDGARTLGENLSDAGGLRAAYAAWVEDRKATPASWDQKLPGLEGFTSEQLFFVYFANMWCSTITPEEMARKLPVDVHAPDRMRVRGMAENSREFREAFKCRVKEAKCELF